MLLKLLNRLLHKEGTPILNDDFHIQGKKVSLRQKKVNDAWNDYIWRADSELAELDAAPRLNMTFEQYEPIHKEDLRYPTPRSKRFAVIENEGEIHIGNCMYYDLDSQKGQTEIGIMIGNKGFWDGGYGSEAVTLLTDYLFNELKLERVYLKTLDWNIRAQKSFTKIGFSQYGWSNQGRYKFMLMEISKDKWDL